MPNDEDSDSGSNMQDYNSNNQNTVSLFYELKFRGCVLFFERPKIPFHYFFFDYFFKNR